MDIDDLTDMSLYALTQTAIETSGSFAFWLIVGMLTWRLATSKNRVLIQTAQELYDLGQKVDVVNARHLLETLRSEL